MNSLKYLFIMFEISVENRFEINGNYFKMIEKVTKMGVWGGSGTEWGPGHQRKPKSSNLADHFGGHFGASLASKV